MANISIVIQSTPLSRSAYVEDPDPHANPAVPDTITWDNRTGKGVFLYFPNAAAVFTPGQYTFTPPTQV